MLASGTAASEPIGERRRARGIAGSRTARGERRSLDRRLRERRPGRDPPPAARTCRRRRHACMPRPRRRGARAVRPGSSRGRRRGAIRPSASRSRRGRRGPARPGSDGGGTTRSSSTNPTTRVSGDSRSSRSRLRPLRPAPTMSVRRWSPLCRRTFAAHARLRVPRTARRRSASSRAGARRSDTCRAGILSTAPSPR